MRLKIKLSIIYVGLLMLITALVLSFIYVSYNAFRKEEFYDRLQEKAETTARLLLRVKEVDKDLLKIIDRNTINEMYDEKVLIFDTLGTMLYSSLDDETIYYNASLLDEIRIHDYIEFSDNDGDEIIGLKYEGEEGTYLVLASAFDKYGKRKLYNLFVQLVIAFIIASLLVFVSSFFYIKQVFKPIEKLDQAINDITEHNLEKRVKIRKDSSDELSHIGKNFNTMMDRLQHSFALQNTFVQHASHELKTPISVITADIDKLLSQQEKMDAGSVAVLNNMRETSVSQAKMVDELLLMQKLKFNKKTRLVPVRMDELVFEEIERTKYFRQDFQAEVNFDSITDEKHLMVSANPGLLNMAIKNLLENAALYAPDSQVYIDFCGSNQQLSLQFRNTGSSPLPAEKIFQPFYRHTNSQQRQGYGLGLALTKQIIEYHGWNLQYIWLKNKHHFIIHFFQS